jgi:hypothetical protein
MNYGKILSEPDEMTNKMYNETEEELVGHVFKDDILL